MVSTIQLSYEKVSLLMPMTFMNLSGESVTPAAAFFNIEPEDVIVIHDELDLDFGRVKVKQGGGHGGHNGLRSITKHLSSDFIRVRCGIGRPVYGDATSHVLGRFTPDEKPGLSDMIDGGVDAVETIIREGVVAAMNRINVSSA